METEKPVEFWNGLQDQGRKNATLVGEVLSSDLSCLRPQLTSQRTPLLLVIFHTISVHRITETLDHCNPRDAPY